MEEASVQFFTEEPLVFTLSEQEKYANWLGTIAQHFEHTIVQLNYIFCTDEYLYKINIDYLQHHTYTDIITFDNAELEGDIEGDIFISIERVKDNAKDRNIIFETELKRVLAHGLLHLLGLKDKSTQEAQIMREKEDWAIALF